jgi:hypothetical protein
MALWYPQDTTRLLLTFAPADLADVRPAVERLKASLGALTVDYALASEPFDDPRGEYIRASLALRIGHSAAAVCLLGRETLADRWVRWTLETACRLERPLLAAALAGQPSREAADLLATMGAEVVSLDGETLAQRVSTHALRKDRGPLDGPLVFRPMAHPFR